MSQWFIDITKYAQQLLDGLGTIEFPESVRLMQEDWLGRSEGEKSNSVLKGAKKPFALTTRPDTLRRYVCHARTRASTCGRLVKGTEYEAGWKAMHDVYANMSEFDRIKNLNRRRVFHLDALPFTH